jgi:hypothetical protein
MSLCVVLLLLAALLLATTAVVPVLLLLGEDDDAAVVAPAAPPLSSSRVKALSWQPRYINSDINKHVVGGARTHVTHTCIILTRLVFIPAHRSA